MGIKKNGRVGGPKWIPRLARAAIPVSPRMTPPTAATEPT